MTDLQALSDAATPTAEEFWRGKCQDCAHDEHPLRSCHEIIGAIGGDPSNGPDYCPCTIDYANGAMEAEIARLRAASPSPDADRMADLYAVASEQARQWATLMAGLGFSAEASAEEVLHSLPTPPRRLTSTDQLEAEQRGLPIPFASPSPDTDAGLDVERLGFDDLLRSGKALLEHYPPDTIVCSHSIKADVGARTVAAITDLIDSCLPTADEELPEYADDEYNGRIPGR